MIDIVIEELILLDLYKESKVEVEFEVYEKYRQFKCRVVTVKKNSIFESIPFKIKETKSDHLYRQSLT